MSYCVAVATAQVSDNPCENGLQYQYHPTDCSKFIQCFNKHPIEFICQAGFYWNMEKEHCDWSWNVKCPAVSLNCGKSANHIYENVLHNRNI